MYIMELAMTDNPFESRVRAAGLRPWPEDMPPLEAMVRDLDRAAADLRGPHPYALEPLSAFRLKPAAICRNGRPKLTGQKEP
jgi:hypothetical protein